MAGNKAKKAGSLRRPAGGTVPAPNMIARGRAIEIVRNELTSWALATPYLRGLTLAQLHDLSDRIEKRFRVAE